ncbi:MAG: phage holin family protein [Candidatus Promineifilaceae bacterium]
MGYIIGLVIAFLVSALVIWIVGQLGLGMEVTGFGGAIIAAIIIAIVSAIVAWLLGLIGIQLGMPGLVGGLITLVVAAVVLMISDRFTSDLKVNGFTGAIIAAIAIGVVSWLLLWVLSLFGLA